MRTLWHSLLWKEWHEHKWKMLALVAIAVSVPLASHYDGPETFILSITSVIIASVFLSALFIGMGVAAGENANKTMPFLQALPVPMWKAGAAKLLWASVTVITPVVAVVGLVLLRFHIGSWLGYEFGRKYDLASLSGVLHWGVDSWSLLHLVGGILAALSMLVWVVASGVNRRDEIRAGAIAVFVFVCAWFLVSYVATRDHQSSDSSSFQMLAVTAPAGSVLVGGIRFTEEWSGERMPGWILILTGCISHSGLVLWFLLRFGRTAGATRESRRAALNTGQQTLWLAPPRRSQLAAVLWKQMRETGPFVMLGVAAIIGSSMLMFQLSVNQGRDGEFSNILLAMCGYLGFFIVIVAGIGVLLDDLKPGLHTFWRSRPINPDLWFWTKFLTGLTITAIALGIPLLLLWSLSGNFRQFITRETMLTIPTLFLSTYCFAVVAMALVRRPIYAAIFTVGLISICSFTIKHILPKSFEFDFEAVAVMAMTLSVLVTISAWLAVRYDIGYKG
jgi:hypothetical protein